MSLTRRTFIKSGAAAAAAVSTGALDAFAADAPGASAAASRPVRLIATKKKGRSTRRTMGEK